MRDERSTPSSPPPPPSPLPSPAYTPPPAAAPQRLVLDRHSRRLLRLAHPDSPCRCRGRHPPVPQVQEDCERSLRSPGAARHRPGGGQLQRHLPRQRLRLHPGHPGWRSRLRRTHRAGRATHRPTLAATGHKTGYTFTITCGAKVTLNDQDSYTSYQLTAVPDQVGKTGDKGYCSDQDGVVRSDPSGGTNCTQPLP